MCLQVVIAVIQDEIRDSEIDLNIDIKSVINN